MPDELQLLEPTKTREPDSKIRLILVEALLLLTQSRPGREHLRQKRAYPVVRNMHKAETDTDVLDRVDRLVNMIARDEEDSEMKANVQSNLDIMGDLKEFLKSHPTSSTSQSIKTQSRHSYVEEVIDSDSEEDDDNVVIEELI